MDKVIIGSTRHGGPAEGYHNFNVDKWGLGRKTKITSSYSNARERHIAEYKDWFYLQLENPDSEVSQRISRLINQLKNGRRLKLICDDGTAGIEGDRQDKQLCHAQVIRDYLLETINGLPTS